MWPTWNRREDWFWNSCSEMVLLGAAKKGKIDRVKRVILKPGFPYKRNVSSKDRVKTTIIHLSKEKQVSPFSSWGLSTPLSFTPMRDFLG